MSWSGVDRVPCFQFHFLSISMKTRNVWDSEEAPKFMRPLRLWLRLWILHESGVNWKLLFVPTLQFFNPICATNIRSFPYVAAYVQFEVLWNFSAFLTALPSGQHSQCQSRLIDPNLHFCSSQASNPIVFTSMMWHLKVLMFWLSACYLCFLWEQATMAVLHKPSSEIETIGSEEAASWVTTLL